MKRASSDYALAMDKQFRDRGYAVVILGIINIDAQNNAEITSDLHYLSDHTNPFAMTFSTQPQYATMEENVFKADGSQYFAPYEAEPELVRRNICVLTPGIGDSISFAFTEPQDVIGFSIGFTEFYPTKFKVTLDSGVEYIYENNDSDWYSNDEYIGVSSVTITPIEFVNGNNKRLRISTIAMGVGIMCTNEDISDISFDDTVSFTSEELPSVTETINCLDFEDLFNVDNPQSFLPYLQTGQEVHTWFGQTLENGSIEYVKMPTLYLDSWSSNTNKVSFKCVDKISTLTETYTNGNNLDDKTLYSAAIDVLTDAGLEQDEFYVDDALQNIEISSPIPEQTHAQCLQLIANAGRCTLQQTSDGLIKLMAGFENIVDPSQLTVTTDTQADWSKPENIRTGSSVVYADMTKDFFSADGSMRFIPNNRQYLNTGYVSLQVADSNGNFYDNLLSDGTHINWSQHGVEFTSNQDGSITAKGTVDSAGYANYWLYQMGAPLTLEPGEYMLSGCPAGGGNTKYRLAVRTTGTSYTSPGWDIGEGDTFTITESTDVAVYIQISTEGNTVENLTFRPMIVKLDDYITEPAGYVQGKVPSLSMELPATFTYFGVNLQFAGNLPAQMRVQVYNDNQLIKDFRVTPVTHNYYLPEEFINFDKITFSFPKGAPYDRVLVNKISFGTITDYTLKRDDMMEKPVGTLEQKVKDVSVKIYTYEDTEDGPKAKDDNVYYKKVLNYQGTSVVFENPLIDNAELAELVAVWLGNYYNNNVTYQVNYRGDPRLDAADIIYMENDYINNLQVNIEKHQLKFNGALSGTLDLRRAVNLT